MAGKWRTITSDAELNDEKGKRTDPKSFVNKGSCSRNEIDRMVDRLERIIPQLQVQRREEMLRD